MAGTMGLQAAPSGYYTFGGGSAEVTRDKGGMITTHDAQGNLMAFTVWDAQVGGNQITDLLDYQGNPLPGTVSPIPDPASLDEGLILFYARNSFPAVFLDRGVPGSVRIALWAREMAALMPATIDKADTALTNSTSALADVDSANTNASDAVSTANATQAQQTQLMTVTPTVDELSVASTVNGAWIAGAWSQTLTTTNSTMGLWSAPFACKVVWAAVSWDNWSFTANDTNYWNVTLRRMDAAKAQYDITVKGTKVTGGESVVNRVTWVLNGGAWNTAAALFAAKDLLCIDVAPVGAPAAMKFPITATFRYQPLR